VVAPDAALSGGVAAYHEDQLRLRLEMVREAFERLDAGEIDVFELDEVIYHDTRSARELWKFCGSTGEPIGGRGADRSTRLTCRDLSPLPGSGSSS